MTSIKDLEDLQKYIEKHLKPLVQAPCIFLLKGDMGVGKTQLVRLVVKEMGGAGVSSPSYSIWQSYETSMGLVDHADFYRLKSEEDLESTGFREVFSNKIGIVFVEWPQEFLKEYIPTDWKQYQVQMNFGGLENSREIQVEEVGVS